MLQKSVLKIFISLSFVKFLLVLCPCLAVLNTQDLSKSMQDSELLIGKLQYFSSEDCVCKEGCFNCQVARPADFQQ